MCKFDETCNRHNCAYKHSAKRNQNMMQFNPLMLMQSMNMPAVMLQQLQKNFQ
jgi:azurin